MILLEVHGALSPVYAFSLRLRAAKLDFSAKSRGLLPLIFLSEAQPSRQNPAATSAKNHAPDWVTFLHFLFFDWLKKTL